MRMRRAAIISIGLAGAVCALAACAAPPAPVTAAPATSASASILASSEPASGSTVAAPVNALKLHFNPPARLGEVTVNGPNGLMPMMVTAIGEVADYSVPLPGLGAGNYTVSWKATAGGREYRGAFAFTVR
jgi:methionine-rich copper-binding protein CopC